MKGKLLKVWTAVSGFFKPAQWITIAVAMLLTYSLFAFGKTVVPREPKKQTGEHNEHDGHNHGSEPLSTDSILAAFKASLTPAQVMKINGLENSITRGDVKEQQIHVFHQLSRYWGDSMRQFIPFAYYQAEAARLENSEKSLTFAAHLLLRAVPQQSNEQVRQWEALQAKDLFERSLKINPANDSSKVGIGACYLYGGISEQPMTGINMIRDVLKTDSTNTYALMTLANGALISMQNDKAIGYLQSVTRLQPANLEAVLMLADVYDQKGDRTNAIAWYNKALPLSNDNPALKEEIRKRVESLNK